jgi:hypothetical protein
MHSRLLGSPFCLPVSSCDIGRQVMSKLTLVAFLAIIAAGATALLKNPKDRMNWVVGELSDDACDRPNQV